MDWVFYTSSWCGDEDRGFSSPYSAPYAPNSVSWLVRPVRGCLRLQPAESPKVAHILITAPAAALCVLARSLGRAGCVAFLHRAWLVQKSSCARSTRPASRGCSDIGPGMNSGRCISGVTDGMPTVGVCNVAHRSFGSRNRSGPIRRQRHAKRPSTLPVPAMCQYLPIAAWQVLGSGVAATFGAPGIGAERAAGEGKPERAGRTGPRVVRRRRATNEGHEKRNTASQDLTRGFKRKYHSH